MSSPVGAPTVAAPAVQPLRARDPHRRGPWLLRGRVGSGGMGTVFLGEHVDTGRLAAVKVMSDALTEMPGFRERFAREIEALRRVAGPFAAAVLGGDADAEQPWLATEYIPAPDLLRLIREAGPLDSTSWQGLAVGLISALADMHAGGVLHRDVKPSNVLVAADGPLLIDFGIAHVVGSPALTESGVGMGTPGWVAPEIIRGSDATPASDMFAAGAVLAFAATGRAPFGDAVPGAVMHAVLRREPDLGGASGYAQILLAGLLGKEPAGRWDSARALEFLTGTGDRRSAGARATQMWRSSAAATRLQQPGIAVEPTRAQNPPASGPAALHVPPVSQAPSRRSGRSALRVGIAAGLLLILPAAAWVGWTAVERSTGKRPAVAAAEEQPEPGVPVEAAEAQTDPPLPSYPLIDRYPPTDAGRTAAETMSTYLAAINGNDASTMCSINVFAPCEELVGGTSQSLWSGVSIDSASQASPSQIDVSFSGTTTQPAAMGPDGDTCTDWNLNYTLTQRGYDWLVTDSGPSYHSPC